MIDDNWDHTTFEMMKAEHRELSNVLSEVRDAVSSHTRDRKQLEDRIARLRELVETHFAHEERGGYLREALDRAPRLVSQAAILQEQHIDLMEDVEKISILVHSGVESPAWWTRIEADFRSFAVRLTKHEHAENKIVQEAFTVDIGTGD